MNDLLKIETILGYVANDNPLRASRDGKLFEGIIPAPTWTEEIILRSGSVTDTVNNMREVIKHYYWQAAKVAPLMVGKDLYDTCHNIWDFLFKHIRYNEDSPGKEELRTFARTFAQRKTGVDCDDFSIAAGSILYFLKIPFYIRIARYAGVDHFQHVYIIVPFKGDQYITIDGVLDEYDGEKPPEEFKDFLVMNTNNLSGIPISVLGSIEDETLNEISGILSGVDFKEVNELEGLGTIASEEQELGAIRNHLIRTRNLIKRRPELISETEHPESFVGMVDYALKYWDTDKRDEALGILEGEENRLNVLEGLGAYPEGHENIDLFYGLSEDGTYNVLGKAKKAKKFFSKIKQAAKKAGKGLKKIGKGIIRYNPLSVSIRAAVLLALKVNLLKVASKLKWGYLTKDEAIAHGFDIGEWTKVKTQLAKAENLFVNTLQGKAENFKRAILTGRAGRLNGLDSSLGIVAAAASTAAAVPFLTKILSLLKNINFKKLIGKVVKKKLQESDKQADGDTPTEDGGSAMPEGGEASDTPPRNADGSDNSIPDDSEGSANSDNSNDSETTSGSEDNKGGDETDANQDPTDENATDNTDNADGSNDNSDGVNGVGKISLKKIGKKVLIALNQQSQPKKKIKPANKPALPKIKVQPNATNTTSENPNPGNLPAVNNSNALVVTPEPQENILTQAVGWIQKNKEWSVVIGTGTIILLYQAFKPKHSLSGVHKGRNRKGKNKKNPPHVISGTEVQPVKRSRKKKRGKRGKKFKL